MSAFDVRIHAIRRRPDRRPFEVRWHAAGRARSRSFITRALAEGYRAELIRAARRGLDFSPGTGKPASWATPEPATISWLDHAAAYAAMKWPLAAAHTRAGIADALATITPALLTPGRGGPPAAVLRRALYGHAFNPARAGADPGPPATVALGWASDHCLPLTALADPAVTRHALDALALRLDETRAAAATITRKRAVFHGCLGYETSAQIRLHVCDQRKYRPVRSVPWIAAPDGRSRALRSPKPLTRPDPAHNWPTATGNGLLNRSRTRRRPGSPGTPAPGLTWGFGWQVLGSNQRRLSRRSYSEPIPAHRNSH
jgi:hypothetical protein